jgi:predicted nuclease with TOPRIM domain
MATGEEDEPELRKQLRAARLAEKHSKMKAALAEKQAVDEELARKKEEQVHLKDRLGEAVNAWKNKHKVLTWLWSHAEMCHDVLRGCKMLSKNM